MKLFKEMNSYLLAVLLALFLGGYTITAQAQEQPRSDYQIQQDFKHAYNTINKELEGAQTSEEVIRLIDRIKSLNKTYEPHKELLNKAIYPETYNSEMEQLRQRAVSAQQRLTTIEYQQAKLDRVNEKLSSYNSRLSQLNTRTDSLRRAMEKSVNSEKRLSGLVRQYRKNLEKRDDLILSFVDSVMASYRTLQVDSMKNMEGTSKKSRLESDHNALAMIQSIANENIEFLSSNPDLSAQEYVRMNVVQHKVEDVWKKTGDKLTEVYAPKNEAKAKKEIQKALTEWHRQVSEKMWPALNNAFAKENIELPDFNDSDSFYNALNTYLANAAKTSEKENSKSGYQKYQNFSNFWTSEVQMNWTPYLTEGGVLSSKEKASIDQQLNQWASVAQPESNMLVYLLGISVLAIVVLGVLLAREKAAHSKDKDKA